MICVTRPKPKLLQDIIICIEQAYLKNRTFFVLTDRSMHSNFWRGSTQKLAKYKPHYTPCHLTFIDTWGIEKWQRCWDRGCNGTKMCQVVTWMNVMVSTACCKSKPCAVSPQDDSLNMPAFFSLLENIMLCIYRCGINCAMTSDNLQIFHSSIIFLVGSVWIVIGYLTVYIVYHCKVVFMEKTINIIPLIQHFTKLTNLSALDIRYLGSYRDGIWIWGA